MLTWVTVYICPRTDARRLDAAADMLRVTPLLVLASGFAPRHAPSTRHGVRRRVGPIADEWPELTNVPLPAKLAGGLFLFAASVPRRDRALADELLGLAKVALNNDPAVTSELGYGLEPGGVYASARAGDRLALQFQIQGGNLWAQGTARGVQTADGVQLAELYVTNMDGAMMGDGGARVRLDV